MNIRPHHTGGSRQTGHVAKTLHLAEREERWKEEALTSGVGAKPVHVTALCLGFWRHGAPLGKGVDESREKREVPDSYSGVQAHRGGYAWRAGLAEEAGRAASGGHREAAPSASPARPRLWCAAAGRAKGRETSIQGRELHMPPMPQQYGVAAGARRGRRAPTAPALQLRTTQGVLGTDGDGTWEHARVTQAGVTCTHAHARAHVRAATGAHAQRAHQKNCRVGYSSREGGGPVRAARERSAGASSPRGPGVARRCHALHSGGAERGAHSHWPAGGGGRALLACCAPQHVGTPKSGRGLLQRRLGGPSVSREHLLPPETSPPCQPSLRPRTLLYCSHPITILPLPLRPPPSPPPTACMKPASSPGRTPMSGDMPMLMR